jgi:hypothetical protein
LLITVTDTTDGMIKGYMFGWVFILTLNAIKITSSLLHLSDWQFSWANYILIFCQSQEAMKKSSSDSQARQNTLLIRMYIKTYNNKTVYSRVVNQCVNFLYVIKTTRRSR